MKQYTHKELPEGESAIAREQMIRWRVISTTPSLLERYRVHIVKQDSCGVVSQ